MLIFNWLSSTYAINFDYYVTKNTTILKKRELKYFELWFSPLQFFSNFFHCFAGFYLGAL